MSRRSREQPLPQAIGNREHAIDTLGEYQYEKAAKRRAPLVGSKSFAGSNRAENRHHNALATTRLEKQVTADEPVDQVIKGEVPGTTKKEPSKQTGAAG